MAVPLVDGIDWDTMSYSSVYGSVPNRGIFEWGFFYKEAEVPLREQKQHQYASEPYKYELLNSISFLFCVNFIIPFKKC